MLLKLLGAKKPCASRAKETFAKFRDGFATRYALGYDIEDGFKNLK
jgi:hypothetical protein